jgi:hypothetical protein
MMHSRHERSTDSDVARRFLGEICASLDLAESLERVTFYEFGDLVSAFPVSNFAGAAIGAAGQKGSRMNTAAQVLDPTHLVLFSPHSARCPQPKMPRSAC